MHLRSLNAGCQWPYPSPIHTTARVNCSPCRGSPNQPCRHGVRVIHCPRAGPQAALRDGPWRGVRVWPHAPRPGCPSRNSLSNCPSRWPAHRALSRAGLASSILGVPARAPGPHGLAPGVHSKSPGLGPTGPGLDRGPVASRRRVHIRVRVRQVRVRVRVRGLGSLPPAEARYPGRRGPVDGARLQVSRP